MIWDLLAAILAWPFVELARIAAKYRTDKRNAEIRAAKGEAKP